MVGRVPFPPGTVGSAKALACELPSETGLPLARFNMAEIKRELIRRGLTASIGETTIWRWLSEDAIRPWHHRSWIFPGIPISPTRLAEKTSIQARRRKHGTTPPGPAIPMRIEHEYVRKGAWVYLAAWDAHRARIFGRCEHKTGIAPFERLVRQVMSQEPYRSATRVFWVVDNGSSHRGERCRQRLARRWPNLVVVHTPIHASWLYQIEIFFSIVQRKVLTPNDFNSLTALEAQLLAFQLHYQAVAKPFQWRFTRRDLEALLHKLASRPKAA